LKIEKGWHVYANPSGYDAATPTEVTVSSKTKPKEVKVEYPEGKEIKDSIGEMKFSYKVYEDKVSIKATVERAAGDTGPLEVTVKFQSCNDKQCLLPATKTVKVP